MIHKQDAKSDCPNSPAPTVKETAPAGGAEAIAYQPGAGPLPRVPSCIGTPL
jgi:hypothetical protein